MTALTLGFATQAAIGFVAGLRRRRAALRLALVEYAAVRDRIAGKAYRSTARRASPWRSPY